MKRFDFTLMISAFCYTLLVVGLILIYKIIFNINEIIMKYIMFIVFIDLISGIVFGIASCVFGLKLLLDKNVKKGKGFYLKLSLSILIGIISILNIAYGILSLITAT